MTPINQFQPRYKIPLFKEKTLDISRYYLVIYLLDKLET